MTDLMFETIKKTAVSELDKVITDLQEFKKGIAEAKDTNEVMLLLANAKGQWMKKIKTP